MAEHLALLITVGLILLCILHVKMFIYFHCVLKIPVFPCQTSTIDTDAGCQHVVWPNFLVFLVSLVLSQGYQSAFK